MKPKPILTVLAVAVAAFAQPVLAGFQFTQNEKGEVTHYNGIELPPIQTVEEAKAQAQKEIAAAKKAREAEHAVAASSGNLQSEIGNQQFFFTGKPYLEETGQYLFLFRHYDPELARWTTADPSGFPDGANNIAYMAVPTSELDWQGLQTITVAGKTFNLGSFHQSVSSLKIDVPGTQWSNSTNHQMSVTYSISGGFQANATILDTGIEFPFSSSTSATVTLDPKWKSKLVAEFSIGLAPSISFIGWEVKTWE